MKISIGTNAVLKRDISATFNMDCRIIRHTEIKLMKQSGKLEVLEGD
jgi:hypothetical protein